MPKIRALRAEIERRGLDIDIQVDGGINTTTVATVVEAGANVLVAGYGVYRAPNHDYAGGDRDAAGRGRCAVAERELERLALTPTLSPHPQAGEGGDP